MGISQLLRRQREGYPKYHQSRSNLLIPIVAGPLFLFGTIALVDAIVRLSRLLFAVAVGCILVAVALQVRGHRLQPVPPESFSGPLNFVSRLFFEQWATFPRFVLSRCLQHCARHASPDLFRQHGHPACAAPQCSRFSKHYLHKTKGVNNDYGNHISRSSGWCSVGESLEERTREPT
jgi:hypothetical protein